MGRILQFCQMVMFFFLLGNTVLATSIVEWSIQQGSKTLHLHIDQLSSDANLQVVDQKEWILHQQAIKSSEEVNQMLDLSNLPDGRYHLSVITAMKEIVQPVDIKGDQLTLKPYLQQTYFKPILIAHPTYFDISWLSNKLSNFELRILNQSGEVVFEEKAKGVLRVQRRYRVDFLEPGSYSVQMITPRKNYSEFIHFK